MIYQLSSSNSYFQFNNPRQSRAFGGSELRKRTGRRNDKFFSIWQNLFPGAEDSSTKQQQQQYQHQTKPEVKKSETRRPEVRRPQVAVTDSPITFIKMPASPYTFQVFSQPTHFISFAQNKLYNFTIVKKIFSDVKWLSFFQTFVVKFDCRREWDSYLLRRSFQCSDFSVVWQVFKKILKGVIPV
jgi:hypothetical protein